MYAICHMFRLPEEKYCENFWAGKCKNYDASKFCESYSWEDWAAHINDSLLGIVNPVLIGKLGKVLHDVAAELHAYTCSHHQVCQRDSIEGDVEPVHEGAKIDKDQDDNEQDDTGREEIQTH